MTGVVTANGNTTAATTAVPVTTVEIHEELNDLKDDVNQHWIIYAGSIVFFMQAGFSLLEAGSVSAKNSTNILFKNLLDACISAICFFGWGYAFASANKEGENKFIGTENFFLSAEDGTSFRRFFFQWAFAATAATIVSGAVAERIKIQSYFLYSIIITSIIYPVVVHWVWAADGFMHIRDAVATEPFIPQTVNLIDFAGSGVVHLTGGICALVGAIFTGPRIGRFKDNRFCGCFGRKPNGQLAEHTAHNRVFAALGVFLLWFGWYGFNAGSTLDITSYGTTAGRVTVTTTLAAASGAITAMAFSMLTTHPVCQTFDVIAPLNGVLAGLVSITAGCAAVTPQGAVGIGLAGGIVFSVSSMILKALRIDDPLDAFSVHGACGTWGVIATGLFYHEKYVVCTGCTVNRGAQIGMQIVGVIFIILWTSVTSIMMFGFLRLGGVLRVDDECELKGLDLDHHMGYTGLLRYKEEMALIRAQNIAMQGHASRASATVSPGFTADERPQV